MNCSPSDSQNQCKVVSKYFTRKTVMDESLTEFQEKKKNFKGPKNTQKPKNKSKSHPKRIRGQKDIRTALKSKKNELVSYSKDFDKVCKQSGIDVDSEQLQLAVALSKSLQKHEGKDADSQSSGSLSAHNRNGKIRSTLHEYGFIVPEIKIAKNKKNKKHRKQYKLLVTTVEEKQQVISDRYSKILFDSFDHTKVTQQTDNHQNLTLRFFHLVTDITYKEIRYNHVFFVENLFEETFRKPDCLLKDWSTIPGRPLSPNHKVPKFDFNKIDCSQEELDNILSGTLKTSQEIARGKYNLLAEDILLQQEAEIKINTGDVEISKLKSHNPTEIKDIGQNILKTTQNVRSCSPDIFDDEVSSIMDGTKEETDFKLQNVIGDSDHKAYESTLKNATKVCDEVMDLTECLIVNSQKVSNKKPMSQLSQGTDTNKTKRYSNNFMDMTECVTGSSQPIREQNIAISPRFKDDNKIDLTEEYKQKDVLDLTQSSDSNDLPVVNISGNKSLDETIIMNDYTHIEKDNVPSKSITSRKYSEEAVIISPETVIKSSTKNLLREESPKLIEIESDDEENSHRLSSSNANVRVVSPIPHVFPKDIFTEKEPAHCIQTANFTSINEKLQLKSPLKLIHNTTKSKTESFFEEFIHHHSESSTENTDDGLCLKKTVYSENKNEGIDLTQSTDSSIEINDELNTNSPQASNTANHTDKIDNAVVDCDEIYNDMIRSHASSSKTISCKLNITDYNIISEEKSGKANSNHEFNSSQNSEVLSGDNNGICIDIIRSNVTSSNTISYKSNVTDGTNSKDESSNTNTDLVLNPSQNSEVFEILDNELDYSLHKSKCEIDTCQNNFDFGGISVVDNMADYPSLRQSYNGENISLNRSSFLPVVDIKTKSNDSTIYSPNISTSSLTSSPIRQSSKEVIAKTPKNSKYVMKTDQVTPMMNYESMSTPEMHAELDKYGLKPFKRKRAIQLLTHVYNQTHPILESCPAEDLPSPSKKLKTSTSPKKASALFKSQKECSKSPRKVSSKSPKKVSSPRKQVNNEISDKENDIYEVTSELPELRDIECSEEDWVFQKREKAKVHSCRVPLHIAFHNYVSSRLRLREAILRYEPVNIDVIHRGLVDNGCRYDPKDLLKFMDRRCITVKTVDNNARNNKKH